MGENIQLWSKTAASNDSADSLINWAEGQMPGTVNGSARSMMATIGKWRDDNNGTLTTAGSANAYTLTANTAYAALATGLTIAFKASFSNTAACTLNVTPSGGAAFGAKAIKVVTPSGEADPPANAIRQNGHYLLRYDEAANAAAGAWVLLAPATSLTTLGVSTFIQTLLDDADASTALSTLGISAFIKTLLDDADAATALSTLGVSTFIQTLLDDADASTARATLYAAPFDALASNGDEINGRVDVSQELGTTGATLTNNTNKYTADMWEAMYNHGAATAVVTSGQVALSGATAIAGFSFGHQIKATTAITSPANGDFARHRQQIEGWRTAKYAFGVAGAFSIAIFAQWYVTASGVGFIRISNSAGNRAYHREVTLSAGLNVIREVIPGDTTGTWETTTSAGIIVDFFVSGTAASPATPNAWSATPATQTTNSTNMLGTNNNLSIVTGFKSLPVVSTLELPSSERASLIMRPFNQELDDALRYFCKSARYGTAPGNGNGYATDAYYGLAGVGAGTGALQGPFIAFPRTMRSAPTMTFYRSSLGATDGQWHYYTGSWTASSGTTARMISDNGFIPDLAASSPTDGASYVASGAWVASARL